MPARSSSAPSRMSGVIVDWNDDRGYGFIQPDGGGARVFVHITAFPASRTRPFAGEHVAFAVEQTDAGRLRAAHVTSARTEEATALRKRGRVDVVGFAVLGAFAVLFAVALASWQLPLWVVALYASASLVALVGYAADKRAAITGSWRERETTLLLVGLIGGWPGAIIAQQVLRHKTRKAAFQAQFWITVAVNVAAFVASAYPGFAGNVAALVGWAA